MALLHPEVNDLERQNCSPFLSKTSVRRTCDLHARQKVKLQLKNLA